MKKMLQAVVPAVLLLVTFVWAEGEQVVWNLGPPEPAWRINGNGLILDGSGGFYGVSAQGGKSVACGGSSSSSPRNLGLLGLIGS